MRNRAIRGYFLFVLLGLFGWSSSAQNRGSSIVTLDDRLLKKNLTSEEALGLIETEGISPDSAFSLYRKGLFSSVYEANHFDNSSQPSATYWMVIKVANRSTSNDWYLELHDPHLGAASVFEVEGETLREIGSSGFYLPFAQRIVQHKNHFFLFSIYPNQQKTLLVKIHSPTFAKFYVSVVKSHQMVNYSLKEYWYLGVYYGALFILLIYNFVLFLSTRQKPFFWYAFFVGTCILNAFREDGLGFQFLWPSSPAFNYFHFDLSKILLLGAFAGFSCSFLDVYRKSYPFFVLIVGFVLCYSASHLVESYFHRAWVINGYLYPIPFVVIYFIAFRFAWKRDKPALHFLIGFSSFLLGVLCFFLKSKELIPNNIYTIYAPNFSVLSEVAIMSYALASKYRAQQELLHLTQQQEVKLLKEKAELDQRLILQMDEQDKLKESINLALENKVAERTLELNAKNEELNLAYQQLSFYKERLETDWVKLDKEKWALSQQVNQRILDSIKGKAVTYEAFVAIFPTNEACLHYLSELKWPKDFVCKQCGHTKYSKGDLPFSRKCTRCTHRETATAGTLFHGVKIDLTKAFYITHVTLFGNGLLNLKELAAQMNLRTATCWNFKKKVEEAQQESGNKISWEEMILRD